MDIIIGFAVYIAAMLATILTGHSIVWGLLIGLGTFLVLGLRRHIPFHRLVRAALGSGANALGVAKILVVIGIITALWRCSGTIMVFVYYGIRVISPASFLLIAFLLSCLLSYALGTSFGVAGTAGVIFMTLAKSGGVDPVITAGVILSGVFFGDRGSPLSGTSLMVAGITGTDIYGNVRRMMTSALVPLLACLAVYGLLSFTHPISTVDPQVMDGIAATCNLSWITFLPALFMLVLPLLKVNLMLSMGISIASAAFLSWKLQGVSWWMPAQTALLGYTAADPVLGTLFDGGGILSMAETILIVLISCSFSGIFAEAKLLQPLQDRLQEMSTRIGRIPVMILLSLASSAAFCNQIAAIQMNCDFMKPVYEAQGRSPEQLALDIENTSITVPAFIPWSIICSVPLALLGAGFSAIPFAVFLYAVPLWAAIRQMPLPEVIHFATPR